MIGNKRKQKLGLDKGSSEELKEFKALVSEGKGLLDRASSELDYTNALQVLSKAILKSSSISANNIHMLYYYRGMCFINLKQYVKAQRDFMEGMSMNTGAQDKKKKILFLNCIGKCKLQMSVDDPSHIEEAIKNYEAAASIPDNEDAESYLSLGNIYRSLKNNCQAAIYYSNAFKFIKSNTILHQTYMNRGMCFREIGEIEKSTKDFIAAYEIKKDDASAYFNIGLNDIIEQSYDKALENFNMAIQLDPSKAYYLNYKGLALYNLEQLQSALTIFKQAIHLFQARDKSDQQLCETLYNMGNCLLKLERYQEALDTFQSSHELCENEELQLKINYSEGLTYGQLQQQTHAIQKFNLTLSLIKDRTYHDLYLSSMYHLSSSLFKKKNYQEVIDNLSKILEISNSEKLVYEMKGKTHLAAQSYQEALEDFQMMLTLDPNDPMAFYYLGKTKTNLSEIDSALSDFFKAMELGCKDSKIINGIACTYLRAGIPLKAEVYSNIALNQNPTQQQFLIQRAEIYIQLKEYRKAIQDLTNSLEINQSNPYAYYQRGISNYKSKQFQSAIKDLLKALQLNPTNRIQADIHYLIGISYANLQNFTQAIPSLTSALEIDPMPKYYHERAKCYLILEQSQEALSDLEQVIKSQPDNAFAYFRRGLAYKSLKMYQEAAQSLMKAREIEPNDPRLILNKKKIYEIKYRKLCEPGQQK